MIPDSWLTSSSKLSANTPAKNGRLNYTAGSSWCTSSSNNYPYLEIDLQTIHIICAVSTQGNHQADQWVKTFSLQSSTDGITWTNYTEDDQVSMKVNLNHRLHIPMPEIQEKSLSLINSGYFVYYTKAKMCKMFIMVMGLIHDLGRKGV